MLKADKIAELLKNESNSDDPLVISPMPDLDELGKSGAASIDLRLGCWFVSLRQSRMGHLKVDESGNNQSNILTKYHYVPFGQEYFLHPGNFVLGITLEWLRFSKDLGAYVIGKSSWGRRGLIIATATGVHPGFKGCLTLELTNLGEIPIAIKPGMKICQLFFHFVDPLNSSFVDSSQFVGLRKPSLGKVEPDLLAKNLFTSRQHKTS